MKKLIFVAIALSVFSFGAQASDAFDGVTEGLWYNIRRAVPAMVRTVADESMSDVQKCFRIGKSVQQMNTSLSVIYRIDSAILQSKIGKKKFGSLVSLETALTNLGHDLGSDCKKAPLDLEAMSKKALVLLRGHYSAYRILNPEDFGRAVDILQGLEVSQANKDLILIPILNTIEIDSLNAHDIHY